MKARLQVGILVFPAVEVLDFAGPYEVFTTASRVFARQSPALPPPFATCTVAAEPTSFSARAGLKVLPEHDFTSAPPIDLLLVPGGVVDQPLAVPRTLDWIRRTAGRAQLTASVCTGAFLLAAAGLLDGRPVTTHWEDIAELRAAFPGLDVVADRRWVDAGNIVTSAVISAGIDMSLHLVERLAGRDLALRTARQMDYRWEENGA
jgi:transcriptional regulator GlxA family with amidase domain